MKTTFPNEGSEIILRIKTILRMKKFCIHLVRHDNNTTEVNSPSYMFLSSQVLANPYKIVVAAVVLASNVLGEHSF